MGICILPPEASTLHSVADIYFTRGAIRLNSGCEVFTACIGFRGHFLADLSSGMMCLLGLVMSTGCVRAFLRQTTVRVGY